MLSDGYHDVPAGKIAAVVTNLEMHAPAALRGHAKPNDVQFRQVQSPDPQWYRDLFRRVGGNWLWFSRLKMPTDDLNKIISDPKVEIHALERDGIAEGLIELDFREENICELAFFGLTPPMVGAGTGSWLMDQAISRAWSKPIDKFHVLTCTLDHPSALAFYVRSGFTPVRRKVEIADDPRVTGDIALGAAPHFPAIAP